MFGPTEKKKKTPSAARYARDGEGAVGKGRRALGRHNTTDPKPGFQLLRE